MFDLCNKGFGGLPPEDGIVSLAVHGAQQLHDADEETDCWLPILGPMEGLSLRVMLDGADVGATQGGRCGENPPSDWRHTVGGRCMKVGIIAMNHINISYNTVNMNTINIANNY